MQFKNLGKTQIFWAAVAGGYFLFIFLLSYLYPLTGDEFQTRDYSLYTYFCSYLRATPRIGALVSVGILAMGRWSFLMLNPFVQSAIVFLTFNILFLRGPDFKTLKDMPAFILICLLSIFAVTQPDQTLFWIGGACNYSWLMAGFLFFMLILRRHLADKPLFKDSSPARILMFFFGIFIGMTNENLAPMAPVILILFAALCIYSKKKLPQWFWWMSAGVIIGLALLFTAPAHYKKVEQYVYVSAMAKTSLFKKAFHHLDYMNDFALRTLLLPVITGFILLLCSYDNFRKILNIESFLYALFFWAASLVMAAVLFVLMGAPARVYYPAAFFGILGFMFALKAITEIYKIDFYKYICLAAVIVVIFVIVPFTAPYINLHAQAAQRQKMLDKALAAGGKTPIYLPCYKIIKGPSDNLTIAFVDGVIHSRSISRYYSRLILPADKPAAAILNQACLAPVI